MAHWRSYCIFDILCTIVRFLYVPNPLFVANVEQHAVLLLFKNNWVSCNFSDFTLMFDKLVKNLFQWKLFSFADLRIGYISVSVYRSYPLTGIEYLYDSFNFRSCLSTVFYKNLTYDSVD